MTNKMFWKTFRHFLTNKGTISDNKSSIFECEKLVYDESNVAETLNVLYINVVKSSQELNQLVF